jgi:hypothetical protein
MAGMESISEKIVVHCPIFASIYCSGKTVHNPCSQGVAYVTGQMIALPAPTYHTELW